MTGYLQQIFSELYR